MLLQGCPYCGSAEESRSTATAARLPIAECTVCGRVVQERVGEVKELFVELAQDSPLCIVTPDFSDNECYKVPPLEDDPFENIGFITAFNTWSLESAPLFTTINNSFSGQLAELERMLPECNNSQDGNEPSDGGGSISDLLPAYFQIVELSSLLGVGRDVIDYAMQLFRGCLLATVPPKLSIEALATAALAQAIQDEQEQHTLQVEDTLLDHLLVTLLHDTEISTVANISQPALGDYMKALSELLMLSQPIRSSFVGVPRYCKLLDLSSTIKDLATHIGEVVLNKYLCTHRNTISTSAAAIYLACQLEDNKKIPSEICKVTGLTEMALLKVYKELLQHLDQLLPSDYNPALHPGDAMLIALSTASQVSSPWTGIATGVSTPVEIPAGLSTFTLSGALGINPSPVNGEVVDRTGLGVTGSGSRPSGGYVSGGITFQGGTPRGTDFSSGLPFNSRI